MPIFDQLIESSSILATVEPTTLGALSPVATNLLVGGFLVISIVMILLVLIQRPQGGGLSGAFGASGGGGAGQTAFGTKTGDVLTYATIGIFICFLTFAIILNFATRPQTQSVEEPVLNAPIQETGTSSDPATSETESDDTQATDLSGTPDALDDLTEQANDVVDDVEDSATEIIEDIPALPTETPAGDE
ncbi:MAG: preprotein translocase subunit SecG [Phycisphaerales bacterium]|nr:preprotein translocase subunit SecG [Phycisphaerales bacterium]